ncbi:threonine/serine ThrE exporter family protein [Nocardioides flavescens]|uniref:Threonine/serine exporter family protein n=1 Tax=Nocardioides flavescens TaxID=2691959 RepID=A0A6L7F163_9ACTN|nr:threonine/serine exporter family protein [Nocardioides flavescens]MXG90062.1 threonine/serine exporter family protein [Nocardioides flavescens]
MASPEPRDVRAVTSAMDLALRIGELLLSSGAGASDVSAAMGNVAYACGLRGTSADVTFTELTMTQQGAPDEVPVVLLRQVRYREVDYGDLTLVDHLIRDLVDQRIDQAEATSRLNRIISTGHDRPRWSVSVALGCMGAGVAMVLGGDALVVVLAALTAGAVDQLQRHLNRRRLPAFYQQVAGGLLATLVAVAVVATPADVSPSQVISTGIIVMLAGVNFLGAIQDALTGYPLTAGARLLEAFLATAGVVAGVSGGLQVADLLGVQLGPVNPGYFSLADLPATVVGGAIAAAAYAFSAYSPVRALLPVAVLSGAAVGVYAVAAERGFTTAWATAVAALLLGLFAYPVSARVRVPALVVIAACITPLLPGLTIYRGLTLLGSDPSLALLAMATAAAIAIALSSGVFLGEYLAQPIRREAHRLESRLANPRLVGPHAGRALRGVRRRKRERSR